MNEADKGRRDDDKMYGSEDIAEAIRVCIDILEENIKYIEEIEDKVDEEREDEFTTNMDLHHLYDMAEDVAESARIKRAQTNFARRQAEDKQ